MLNWTFELDNYYDDGGIECTDGSEIYLVFFAAECTGVAEGRYNGSGDDEEFDIEIPNEEAEKIVTVGDAVEAIKKAVNN